jgi:hypothetical protein
MSKKIYTSIVVLSILFVAIGVGCLPFSYYITPGRLDRDAKLYTIDAGVAEPNDYDGYQNLAKLDLLQRNVDKAYAIKQQELDQLAETNNLKYSLCKGTVASDKESALKMEDFFFGEKGLISFGLAAAGLSSLSGVVCLMRKRPGDITSSEYESALAQAQNKSVEELSEKEKQFIQLVKTIEEFKKLYKGDENYQGVLDSLKTVCNANQDSSTQVAVATIKKS